jgi:excisionase family DNA binding protein
MCLRCLRGPAWRLADAAGSAVQTAEERRLYGRPCIYPSFSDTEWLDQHQLDSMDVDRRHADSVDVFDEYLTVSEITKTLRLNDQMVRTMIDRSKLRAVRVGQRRVRVLRAELDAFLADRGPDHHVAVGARRSARGKYECSSRSAASSLDTP